LSIALMSKDDLNTLIFAAVRLVYVTHRDKHYGNLRYCAQPLQHLISSEEERAVIALKSGDNTLDIIDDMMAYHEEEIVQYNQHLASASSTANVQPYSSDEEIEQALPNVSEFMCTDVDQLKVSEITLAFSRMFTLSGYLHKTQH